MKERLRNTAWGAGVAGLHLAKRLGISGPFERKLIALGGKLLPPPGEETEISLPWGMRFTIPPRFRSARTYASGRYEQEVTSLLADVARPGMGIIDVGAFCGYYTLLASYLTGPQGRVYAFEANPTNYRYLLRNIRSNACTNVRPFNLAVSNHNGGVNLVAHDEADHGWISKDLPGDFTVHSTALDAFFEGEGWPQIDLTKLDIEGSECAALDGMGNLAARNPQMQLIMEFDRDYLVRSGATRELTITKLQGLGFNECCVLEKTRKLSPLLETIPRTRGTYNLFLVRGAP